MSEWSGKYLTKLLSLIRQSLRWENRELITGSGVAVCLILLRLLGLLQFLEWAALDQFFQWRPMEAPEARVTIVAIDEASLRQIGSWPMPDAAIAQLLQKLNQYQPRAIGLDIYRDLRTDPGHEELTAVYQSMSNLIGIELLSGDSDKRVAAPAELSEKKQVGFNNLLLDADGKVRRSLLYWHLGNQLHESFALKLAKLYLKQENILPQRASSQSEYLQLGKAIFQRLQPHDGGYVGVDNRGYQIVSNFPKPACSDCAEQDYGFSKVSMRNILAGNVPSELIRDRVVLIGSTAPSLQDLVLIPYSSRLMGTAKPVGGVELQAYFVAELISASLDGRPLMRVWSDIGEYLWIFVCSYAGAVLRSRIRRIRYISLGIFLVAILLIGGSYGSFLLGWWIPLMPGFLAFASSVITITSHIAHTQEELKRSKQFLDGIINTIADPVFVKNEKHQLMIVNEAFCEFIGYPQEKLIGKSDYDLFCEKEAEVFWWQDELIFRSQKSQEHEEELTNADKVTFLIATKRSLHKDAAGNCFLVGVIRDITERKLLEQELKATATELFRSNSELKSKEDELRYVAYHDTLTGLSNRKYFHEQLEESLEWAKNNQLLLGLLFIDLDGFKQVNDTLGHEMGDRLLVTIAQRLSNILRGSDTVSRLGGDEFTVILRTIPEIEVAARVAEKILHTITDPVILDGNTIRVSASIGISIYPINSYNQDTLIKQADNAMYRAKNLGKNRYEFA
ncbi:CHASE2 domain-containing protein [Calothrix sp. 336/3]|uniref:CHASE2 domain-containing protein n=1 Tax=Calothrix sp. 336/3 TaxID=1337936 RepID=UPI0004E36FEC|nr:CHASE2 domain-containing protein [Calothrix sp. 336/3]AKG21995.1 diguanylate cyclase [Calothrix sp. 336/3]